MKKEQEPTQPVRNMGPTDDVLGWMQTETGLLAITPKFFTFLHTCPYDDDQTSKAKRTARYVEWLHAAEQAETAGDEIALKEIADAVRVCMGIVPKRIPRGGFSDINAIRYDSTLTSAEIRSLILADIERRKMQEFFEAAETIRKGRMQ